MHTVEYQYNKLLYIEMSEQIKETITDTKNCLHKEYIVQ